jgi:hypothetical protein
MFKGPREPMIPADDDRVSVAILRLPPRIQRLTGIVPALPSMVTGRVAPGFKVQVTSWPPFNCISLWVPAMMRRVRSRLSYR